MLAATKADEIVAVVFVDIALILVVARLMGAVARRLRQPAVVGEIVGGILLGPSLLGAFPGDLPATIFPADARPYLFVVAQLGLIIFMFIVGLELDLRLIRGQGRVASAISVSSVILPFTLGIPLAAILYDRHDVVDGNAVEFLPFALFIGASMSVTAFPVLARILTERGMMRTRVGALTISCAAVDDVIAWSLLAVVLAVVASAGAWDLPRILLLSIAFVAVMVWVVRPLLERFVAERFRRSNQVGPEIMAIVLVGMLLSSYATAEIGIHQIFGAFLFGAVMPRDAAHRLITEILQRLETVSVLLLLPVFFVATGLGVDVRGIGTAGIGELAMILLVACAGKFLGAFAGARAMRVPTRRAATIGVLMNTRGLTELVILNVGRAFGVLDPQLFTMLVVMAIFTTIITEPILRVVYPPALVAAEVASAERDAVTPGAATRVLVSVGDPVHAARMVDIAADIAGGEPGGEVVITRFAPRDRRLEIGGGVAVEREQVAGWLGELHDLARRVEARGVRSVVLHQLSDDVAADLVAQASSIGAQLLLVGGPRKHRTEGRSALARFEAETGLVYRDFVRHVLREARCDVAVVVHPRRDVDEGAGVMVVLGGSSDHAAVELAARLAGRRATALALVDRASNDGPPAQALVAHLRATGADAAVAAWPGGDGAAAGPAAWRAAIVAIGVGVPPGAGAGSPFGEAVDAVVDSADGSVLVVRAAAPRTGTDVGAYQSRLGTVPVDTEPSG